MENLPLSLAAGGADFAGEDTSPKFLPDTAFDTEQVELDLEIDLSARVIQGSCRSTVNIVSADVVDLVFDAVEMEISAIKASPEHAKRAQPCAFDYDRKKLTVHLPRSAQYGSRWVVEISYRLKNPPAGVHFFGPSSVYPEWPLQAWTQGQSDDARCWFPCRDIPSEKATSDIKITVAQGLMAIANGVLVTKTENTAKKTVTYHWRLNKPHSMYLFSLVVGRFEMAKDSYRKVPLLYYFQPGKKAEALRGLRKTAPAMEFLIQETGVHYPYEQYSQVVGFQFLGGMENTSVTTQTDRLLLDERAAIDMDFDSLVVHELAHQWFGDLVTCKDWTNGWLNEGFASYYETLFFLGDQGIDEFRRRCSMMARSYFEEAEEQYQRPIVTRVWRESFQLFDRHLYTKGGCVLHFLRSLLGESAWRRAVWYYLEKYRFGSVETKDLIKAIYESTGRNLESQFEQWIFRPGHPEFKIAFEVQSERSKTKKGASARCLRVWIAQKQALKEAKNLFSLPVEFALVGKRKRVIVNVDLTKPEHVFEFPLDFELENLVFDPENHVLLKKVEWVKPLPMWEKQLSDPDLLIRMEAAENLAGRKTAATVEILERGFESERFWWGKARIAELLGEIGRPESRAFLFQHLGEANPRVRRAIVQALGKHRLPEFGPDFDRLFRKDPSIFVAGAALKALGMSGHALARTAIRAGLKTSSWMDWIKCCALDALMESGGTCRELAPFLEPGISPWLKVTALRLWTNQDPHSPDLKCLAQKLLEDPSEYVGISALTALEKSGDPALVGTLRKLLDQSHDSIRRSILDAVIRTLRLGKTDDLPKCEPVVAHP
jgi:aminopeptidase N